MNRVKKTERGWGGHFIGANSCRFRRNTLLELASMKIVVSTVGLYEVRGNFEPLGVNRYYETMAFHSDVKDGRHHDADVTLPVEFDSNWSIGEIGADDLANDMHESVVDEISNKMMAGELPEPVNGNTA